MTRTPRSTPILALAALVACGCAHTPAPAGRPAPCPELTEADADALAEGAGALLTGDQADALDRALVPANRLERCRPDHPARPALEQALRERARSNAQALTDRGDWAGARFALARLEGRLDLTEALHELEQAWATALRTEAEADAGSGRQASACVRRSMAAGLTRQPEDLEARARAWAAFLETDAVSVPLAIEADPEPRQLLEQALDSALAPLFRRAPADAQAEAGRVTLDPVSCEERVVKSVATIKPRQDGRRERIEAELAEAEEALAQAARDDRKLRKALEQAEGDSHPERRPAAMDRAEVQRVERARDALEALDAEPEGPGDGALSYEIDVGTLECTFQARLALPRSGTEPLLRTLTAGASTTDSAHPAHVEWDLAEDPLAYRLDRQALTQQATVGLAEQLEALLREHHASLLSPPSPSETTVAPAALEDHTRRALLALLADPVKHRDSSAAFLLAVYGLGDLDWLAL